MGEHGATEKCETCGEPLDRPIEDGINRIQLTCRFGHIQQKKELVNVDKTEVKETPELGKHEKANQGHDTEGRPKYPESPILSDAEEPFFSEDYVSHTKKIKEEISKFEWLSEREKEFLFFEALINGLLVTLSNKMAESYQKTIEEMLVKLGMEDK